MKFNKEVGKNVQECKLKVVYVSPPRPPSPVPEEPEEVHSPRASRTEMVNQDENSAVSSIFCNTISGYTKESSFLSLFLLPSIIWS